VESVLNPTVAALIGAIHDDRERMEELMVDIADSQRFLDGAILKLCRNIISHHRLNLVPLNTPRGSSVTFGDIIAIFQEQTSIISFGEQ
jgi:hypothetical protein